MTIKSDQAVSKGRFARTDLPVFYGYIVAANLSILVGYVVNNSIVMDIRVNKKFLEVVVFETEIQGKC